MTETKFSVESAEKLNKFVIKMQNNPISSPKDTSLGKNYIRLKIHTESSFSNSNESTSQFGYIFLLTGKTRTWNILSYSSKENWETD